tara:strand:+ start:7741 stop:11472 length:3732 start_codon:yes stop_codon:yes gene_type:complete
MPIPKTLKHPKFRYLFTMTALQAFMICGTAQGTTDFGIDDDTEYSAFINAIRAAEYVRSDVIVAENPKPRVYATLAAVMAFAERNPNATDPQLAAFLAAFDTAVQVVEPIDPDLNKPASFYAAMMFSVIDAPELIGTDTMVGKRALKLLGVTIPDPDGFESIQRRMVRYEVALARPLDYRNEVFDLLVSGFFGQDPSGNQRTGLPAILDAYFESEGFDPELHGIRPDLSQVDAGLSILPVDFTAYQLAISEGPENLALRDQIAVQFESVQNRITQIVGTDPLIDDGTLDDALATAPGLEESVDLTLNDPAYFQQVLDELRANLEATSQARAAASAATLMMLQSDFDSVDAYATYARDYNAMLIESNDTLSHVQTGVSLAGNLAIGAAAFYTGDPLTGAGALLSVTTEVLGLASDLTNGPSDEEQIFEQVVALRQQVEAMRLEMHERFDSIDSKLNIMYDTITHGFNEIGDQIGDLQADVNVLIYEMAAARSQLRRLEAALYGVAQDILLTDLTSQTNIVLDYRDENGVDLPYSGGSPDFITASESFFTYATVTSLSEAFSGSRTNPTLNADNADEIVGDGPVSAYLNDLAVLPQSLGLPALAASDLPGIEPWSQAASAYAQLARENPWYFSYRYGKQVEDYNMDPKNESLPELDRIIRSGDQIVEFIDAIRETDANGDSALFDAILDRYRAALPAFQSAIDNAIPAALPTMLNNGSTLVDLWQIEAHDVMALTGYYEGYDRFDSVGNNGIGDFDLNRVGRSIWHRAFIPEASHITIEEWRMQTWHLLMYQSLLDEGVDAAYYSRPTSMYSIHTEPDGTQMGELVIYSGDSRITDTSTVAAKHTIRFVEEYWNINLQEYIDITHGVDIISISLAAQSAWNYSSFATDLAYNRSALQIGARYDTDQCGGCPFGINNRIRIEYTESTYLQDSDLYPLLYDQRLNVYTALMTQLVDPQSPMSIAAGEFNRVEALLDAYVTLAMPDELNKSEVLRSALRAAPGSSELGLRSEDMIRLILDIQDADSPNTHADQEYSVKNIDGVLNARIDFIRDEIKRGLARPTTAPDYVEWMLNELTHLRNTAFDIAVDDMYIADSAGIVETTAINGVLINDVDQEFRTIVVDTLYEFDPMYQAPEHGQVTVNADGSFTYQANPGFVGTDAFSYRTMTTIPNVAGPVYSDSATAVVVVTESSCGPADFTNDGRLNFFDVSAFLIAYQNEEPQADLSNDGEFNFFDVSAFLVAYSEGCP